MNEHPQRSPIVDAAYAYINQHNWTLVAVGHNKKPMGEWGIGGTNRYDYTNLERVFAINAPGIGVITGPSGLVIIDLDNADAIKLWADTFGIPMTRMARTPRGRHLYYLAPHGLHIPPGTEILPGVDVRGAESYAILPPSHLANGAYSWINADAPILPLPDDVTRLVTQARPERKKKILSGEPFGEGGRNDHLFAMACSMRRGGFDHASILAALHQTNKTRCVPPLSANEVEAITDSAIDYEEGTPSGLDWLTHFRAKQATREPDEAPVLTDHTRLLDTKHLVTNQPERIDWVWEDFLAPGTLNMLHGEGGLGKSFIALKIAEQLVNEQPDEVFGKQVHPGGVVILDGENAEVQIHRRIQHTTITADADLSVYVVSDVVLGLEEVTEQYFDHLEQKHNPRLIIVDSQRALWAGDEKEQAEAGRMLRRFGRYVETKPYAVLLIHHDNRGGDYSGSSDINAAITGCRLHIKRHTDKAKPNARVLTQPKNRIAPEVAPQEFLLDITQHPDSHRFLTSGIKFTPYVSDHATQLRDWINTIITRLANPGTDAITYREAWSSFGWTWTADGPATAHKDDWKHIKDTLEERGYQFKIDGPNGGKIRRV